MRMAEEIQTQMRQYLRRLYGLHRLQKLEAPEILIEERRRSIRDSWTKLVGSLRSEFGESLINSDLRAELDGVFRRIADEIGMEELNGYASDCVLPCNTCPNYKYSDGDYESTGAEFIKQQCIADPELVEIAIQCGRFTHPVYECRTYKGEGLEENFKRLEKATAEFDAWRDSLKFAESLMD